MPATLNLGPYQRGDTVPLVFTFSDGVDPIDMRGKTLVMTVKLVALQSDDEAVLEKSITPDAGDTAAENGGITLTLEHSDTLDMLVNYAYSYSLRVIEPASPEDRETTYITGTLTLEDA